MDKQVIDLASQLHDLWRQPRWIENEGKYEPRWKTTKDATWIAAHGTDQVDIANTAFIDLPSDWQAENRIAAEQAIALVNKAIDEASAQLHDGWLERNVWARGTNLDKPYEQLPVEEQQKDRQIILAACGIAAQVAL